MSTCLCIGDLEGYLKCKVVPYGTYLRWEQWLVIKLKHQINKGIQYFHRSVLDGFGSIKVHGNLL